MVDQKRRRDGERNYTRRGMLARGGRGEKKKRKKGEELYQQMDVAKRQGESKGPTEKAMGGHLGRGIEMEQDERGSEKYQSVGKL